MKAALVAVAGVVALGACLTLAPSMAGLPALLSGLLAVLAGVATSAALARELSPEAVGFGALGALAFTGLTHAGATPAIAAAALVVFAYGARAARARTLAAHAAHLIAALLCGAIAGGLVAGYATDGVTVQIAAVVMGTLIAGAPLLLPVDDPIAAGLREVARGHGGVLRRRLLRAVVLRRRMVDHDFSPATARRLERAWRALLRAARARARARAASAEVLDRRIAEYVRSLGDAWRSGSTTRALTEGVDDVALAGLRLHREDLVAEAAAMVEAEGTVEAL